MTSDRDTGANVTLLLPGLLPGDRQSQSLEKYPVIDRFAAIATPSVVATDGLESAALNWFRGDFPAEKNCAASLGYRLDYPDAAVDANCLRADPVYQELDINQAVLAHRSVLQLQQQEADEIIQDLNRHFQNDGMSFHSATPDRWYCLLPRRFEVVTTALGAATGKSVSLTMPSGQDAGIWRGWLTEIEMILYSHPVNQHRLSNGKTPVNSLWLWGEGDPQTLLAANNTGSNPVVYADDFYVKGIADFLEVECRPLANLHSAAESGSLIVDDRLFLALTTGNAEWYDSVLAELEQRLFEPLESLPRDSRRTVDVWVGENRWLRAAPGAAHHNWLTAISSRLPWLHKVLRVGR